jgi:hypothetical protein
MQARGFSPEKIKEFLPRLCMEDIQGCTGAGINAKE